MTLTEKQRRKLNDAINKLFDERPNAPAGLQFSIDEQKRLICAVYEGLSDGVTDLREVWAHYYGLGGVSQEKCLQYLKTFGRVTGYLNMRGYQIQALTTAREFEKIYLEAPTPDEGVKPDV